MIRLVSRTALLTTLLTLLIAVPALAHKVTISAIVRSGVVHTDSHYYGDNTPVAEKTVEVRDANSNELLLTGTTNKNGQWAFPVTDKMRNAKQDLLLIIKAGLGHQGQARVPAVQYL